MRITISILKFKRLTFILRRCDITLQWVMSADISWIIFSFPTDSQVAKQQHRESLPHLGQCYQSWAHRIPWEWTTPKDQNGTVAVVRCRHVFVFSVELCFSVCSRFRVTATRHLALGLLFQFSAKSSSWVKYLCGFTTSNHCFLLR